MADSSVIREFLVQLGFKTDEASLKKFTTGIENAGKNVVKLVGAIEGAALAVSAGVAAFAGNMDKLYFASQRVGSSANNIKSLESAMRNFGVSADESVGALEGIARFMRSNPAGEGIIRSLGVETRKANGELRDNAEILVELSNRVQQMPYYLAEAYTKDLGISEKMLLAMRSGKFEEEFRKGRERLRGTDFDAAAKKAALFTAKLNDLKDRLYAVGVTIGSSLIDKLGPDMERAARWFERNADLIADRVIKVSSAIINMAAVIGPPIAWIVDKFIDLDRATDGWSTQILLLVGAFKMLGGFQLIAGIWKMVAAVRALAAANAAAGAAAGGAAAGSAAGGGLLASVFPWLAKAGVGLGLLLHSGGLNEGEDAELARRRAAAGASNNPPQGAVDAFSFFQKMGWSKEQAAGIVANLRRESQLNPSAVGDKGKAYGIAQWHPDRQANFAKWAGKDIRQSTLQEQLNFVHYELTQGSEKKAGNLLRAARNAQQAGEVVSRYYERPGKDEATRAWEADRRGNAAVQIAQTTNINVSSSDPAAAGRAVASEQDRVNAAMARNMQARAY